MADKGSEICALNRILLEESDFLVSYTVHLRVPIG